MVKMTKQQLANKIWMTANKLRSKIEANEYKDYILGMIFYRYLCEKEINKLPQMDSSLEELKNCDAADAEYIQEELGYFISYDNLYDTWLKLGHGFSVDNVINALNDFNNSIPANYQKIFGGIFDALADGIRGLDGSAAAKTKFCRDLIELLKDIPMDNKQGYDVLGFVYEYLIGQFAANAGKKAGEFFSPHEASVLISEIISYHLRDRKEISIYDGTAGSGGLLINIGKSFAKMTGATNNITYYAQELNKNTYNLTRMNLVMHEISKDNIYTRNGDTLADDWPLFEENDPQRTYKYLDVDAAANNPPYSQSWTPKTNDPRFNGYGIAPASKADYAFLLHSLYHLKPNGIMGIILPHGVLFRGNEEEEIRKQLIENNNIDTIIGLPANIFFGTSIPTIIIILKKDRPEDDVLIIDASKGFTKEGKQNKLRACDIKRIVDTYIARHNVEKYARVVSRDEIRANNYNLNIPRYVDSSEAMEEYDLYASVFGGIPKAELAPLQEYWQALPQLQQGLFEASDTPYTKLLQEDVAQAVNNHQAVIEYKENFKAAFSSLIPFLEEALLKDVEKIQADSLEDNIKTEAELEDKVSQDIFARLDSIPLVDKYVAYQFLDDEWQESVGPDRERILAEGFSVVRSIEEEIELKTEGDSIVESFKGLKGAIMPFELVQDTYLRAEKKAIEELEQKQADVEADIQELLDNLSEEDKGTEITNDDGTAFVNKEVNNKIKGIMENITSPEIQELEAYNELDTKDKKAYVPKYDWSMIPVNKGGTYNKGDITKRIKAIKEAWVFPENSLEAILITFVQYDKNLKAVKSEIKAANAELEKKTIEIIKNLTDEQAVELLHKKWIDQLMDSLYELPATAIERLISQVEAIAKKYAKNYYDIENELEVNGQELANMLGQLTGSDTDMEAINSLAKLLQE